MAQLPRRDIGMGLSQLETRVLSRQTAAEEFPAVIRHPLNAVEVNFTFRQLVKEDHRPEVDRRNPGRLPFQVKAHQVHYSHQTSEED